MSATGMPSVTFRKMIDSEIAALPPNDLKTINNETNTAIKKASSKDGKGYAAFSTLTGLVSVASFIGLVILTKRSSTLLSETAKKYLFSTGVISGAISVVSNLFSVKVSTSRDP